MGSEEKERVDFPGQKSCSSWRKDEGTWKALRGAGAVVGINMHITAENLKIPESRWNQEVKNYSPWTKPSPLPVFTKFYGNSYAHSLPLAAFKLQDRAEPCEKEHIASKT